MRCRIYTDGSYDNENNIGGWSNIIVNKDKIKVKSGIKFDTTNNQVELIAVLNALEYAVRKHIRNVEIVTDSMYVLNGIQRYAKTWRENNWIGLSGNEIKYKSQWEGILMMLECMTKNKFNVKFTKVKSHSGSSLNELADKEARRAIKAYKEK